MKIKHFLISYLIINISILTGCASNAKFEQMTYKGINYETLNNKEFMDNIKLVTVDGGSETDPLGASQVNNENFKKALTASLQNARLLNSKGRYGLSAKLLKLNQPLFGINFTVSSDIYYELKNLKDNKVILNKNITSHYTGQFNDAFLGVERLRMASEGAVRENIKMFIKQLYQMK